MKADFDIHEGTYLLYPTRKDVWRKDAGPIADVVLNLSALLSRYEKTTLGVLPDCDKAKIRELSVGADVIDMLYNDIWIRDSGAVPVGDHLVKFGFNAWGGEDGLYSDWSQDSTVPNQMSEHLKKPLEYSELILEGGNLLSNGRGTLIAIKKTICNSNRNPCIDEKEAEVLLKRALGVRKIIWLDEGLVYDETGGHVDNICAFADEHTVFLAWTDDPGNVQYQIVRSAFDLLCDATDADGKKFRIIKIPLPNIFKRTKDDCIGLELRSGSKERAVEEPIQPSYINFIFANKAVIVPSFDCPTDSEVKALFEEIFPDRDVIQFAAREIVLGGGGLHCITKNY